MNNKKRILLIDDDDSLRENTLYILVRAGWDVEAAENGLVGLEKVKTFQPDLIVCDINMPELDGYGVLNTLRKQEDTATIPFIFLTGMGERGHFRIAMEMGADDYISKPFKSSELVASIRRQLEKQEILIRLSRQKLEDVRLQLNSVLPHEFRTPITCILGFSQLLGNMPMESQEEVTKIAQGIHRNALRLLRLFENYLLYAKIESKELEIHDLQLCHTEDATEFLSRQALLQARQYQREADLELHLAKAPTLRIAEQFLKKIIEEILDNAFKFSRAGAKVSMTGRWEKNWYIFQVNDYGRGMTAEQIGEIGAYKQFDRNYYEQ